MNMDRLLNVFFLILRSAVCGYELTAAEKEAVRGADIEKLKELAAAHDIAHLVAYGLDRSGLGGADDKNEIFKAAYRYEQLNYELQCVCKTLEAAGIPFMPLKGSVIREFYPEPWMRSSGDIDVLVKESDLEKGIAVLTEKLGYRDGGRWTHDVSLYSPSGVHIELHFDLVEDSYAQASREVLAGVWDCALSANEGSYRKLMTDETFYLYHLAHMAKHFEHGGCGIRPFIDMWILENRVEHSNEKRDSLLDKAGLLKFANSCRKLSEYWLCGAEADGIILQMADYILRGGVYGTLENGFAAQKGKKGGKLGYVISRAFPPLSAMSPRFPKLKKYPFLLPFFWIYRMFLMVKTGRMKTTANELKLASAVSGDAASEAELFIREIGL